MTTNILPRPLIWAMGLLLIVVLGLISLDKSYNLKDKLEHVNPANTLSVTAEGKVKAVPDLATVDIGVVTNADTAAAAQDQSAKKINAIIDFVKQQGISRDDIATSQFNIYPQQNYDGNKNNITGYTANQSITIKVHEVDKSTDRLSKILGGVTAAGANQVNGVALSFNDPDDLRQQAREQAITKAQEKAAALAKTAGLRLGRTVNVSEADYGSPYPIPYAAGGGFGGADMRSVAPNIEPGNQDIVSNMTVTFEVK